MKYKNVYFINGTAYAGKSTMVKMLSEKYHGIACEENYHDVLISNLDSNQYPGLTYTRDLKDWADFVRRTPDEYEAWIEETTKECAVLELQILDKLSKQGKMIFVDTNIPTVVCHAKREKLTSKIQKSHFRKNAIIGITKPS